MVVVVGVVPGRDRNGARYAPASRSPVTRTPGHARRAPAGRADAEIIFLARAALSAPLRGVIFDLRTYVSRWAVHYAVVTVRVDFLRRTDVDFPLWAALHAELGLERSGQPIVRYNFQLSKLSQPRIKHNSSRNRSFN